MCNLKRVGQWKLNQEAKDVNQIMKYKRIWTATDTNHLIKAATIIVLQNLNVEVKKKIYDGCNKRKYLWWKIIEAGVDMISKGISVLKIQYTKNEV